MITDSGLLFIEPKGSPSAEPLIDELTVKMAEGLRRSKAGVMVDDRLVGGSYRGVHTCRCGVTSSNTDHLLPNGEVTNSLAAHYLAWHREEVPQAQLDKVKGLPDSRIIPSAKELVTPPGK